MSALEATNYANVLKFRNALVFTKFSLFTLPIVIAQELADIRSSGLRSFRDIEVDDRNILIWSGLICPVSFSSANPADPARSDSSHNQTHFVILHNSHPQDNAPYNKGAFRIEITFPAEYPFKPPKICFKTKIYHPNIDEKGQVCLPIVSAENWKPATKTDQGESN